MKTNKYFVDLHIHIGRDKYGKPVKITASNNLSLENIIEEAKIKKGIDMIGVIDAHTPAFIEEMHSYINNKKALELAEGGIEIDNVCLILGSEVEIYDHNCKGPIHVLCYFPTLKSMDQFSRWLSERVTNINLSSQRYYGSAIDLQHKVKDLKGLFIPAHIFTPFKSLYGKGVKKSLIEVLDPGKIDAVELGLSSDTTMAEQIEELETYSFLTNSDAHSLGKIAREYQQISMMNCNFKELAMALKQTSGRKVEVNYGLNPLLGKYYNSVCKNCLSDNITDSSCNDCGRSGIIKGVAKRIQEISNSSVTPVKRPPYIHQVPLDFLPGLGPKTLQKLLKHFGTEMHVLHYVSYSDLKSIIGERLASAIIMMREGKLEIKSGGGGRYGKINK
ncbi:endonuclease Q family protein [Saliterribacillus persicus]|uniref:Uncharacterized protein (TIGR00375 family) n=1 Tax=Saliterribacillus persicus TaxID=930114 RepID=A0A368XCW4_9BACI|nr:endonuclease Q family protein [Saliterribacillus persicus]RCW64848.1 uncharacterized protein (TIGR00375 family) [Saliterribacillus persicus]